MIYYNIDTGMAFLQYELTNDFLVYFFLQLQ